MIACALDCYDLCSFDERLKPAKDFLTDGYLCPILNRFEQFPQIDSPMFEGKAISLDEAMDILVEKIKASQKMLYYKGSGNLGKMQDVTKLFFANYATVAKGSLCDGAGQEGIKEGRGKNFPVPLSTIDEAQVVVVWGRNITSTHTHLLKRIEKKIIVVIDPVKTDIAKRADFHLQINPRSDFELAMLLSRFVLMEGRGDKNFEASDMEEFEDFVNTFRLKDSAQKIGADLVDIATLLELVIDKKVLFFIGNGVQKYATGSYVLHAIDSFAGLIGAFSKRGSGVSYFGDTSEGLANPFDVPAKTTNLIGLDFGAYDLCFIQGANPANQHPNSQKVKEGLNKSFVVYFGTMESQTSQYANLIIPAKDFRYKKDIRFSYSSEFAKLSTPIQAQANKLSEYELTQTLFEHFALEGLKSEEEYLASFTNQCKKIEEEIYQQPSYKEHYYQNFFNEENPFCLIETWEDEFNEKAEGYFFITPKAKKALNSQFEVDNYLYIPSSCALKEHAKLRVVSPYGEATFDVKIDARLKENCILIHSGAQNVNHLTPSISDDSGTSAIFQEFKVALFEVE